MCIGYKLHYLLQGTDPRTLRADHIPTWCQDRGDKKAKRRLRSLVQYRSITVEIWSMTLLQVKTCHVTPKEHPGNLDTTSHSCIKFTSWMLSFIAMIVTVRDNFIFILWEFHIVYYHIQLLPNSSLVLPKLLPSQVLLLFQKQTKRPLKTMVPNLCWPTTPEHGTCPGLLSPLERTDFLSPSSYHLGTGFRLGVELSEWHFLGFWCQELTTIASEPWLY